MQVPPESRATRPESFSAPGVASHPVATRPIADTNNDPFGASAARVFDPNEGVIDSGESSSGVGKGLILFAAVVALGFGSVVGWMGNDLVTKKARVASAKEKGQVMLSEVQQVATARKSMSLGIEDVKKAVAADPRQGASVLTSMLTANFDKHPKVEDLFGWQLASINTTGVKKVFDLYEEANGLKLDLGYLAQFINEFGPTLAASGGPSMFGIMHTKDGANLVEVVNAICDMETKSPCESKSKADEAAGYEIRSGIGGAETIAPKGTAEGQVVMLQPDKGNIFTYAIGLEPNKNGAKVYASLLGKVQSRLEAMNKAEAQALNALKNYSDNPDVDGSTPQAEP